jgi:hypothetical protein
MNEHFVSFELSLKLKEIGYDEPCWFVYKDIQEENITQTPVKWNNSFDEGFRNSFNSYTASAPIWAQPFQWFSDNGFKSYIIDNFTSCTVVIYDIENTLFEQTNNDWDYNQSRIVCLTKLIEFYVNQQKTIDYNI